MDTSPSASGSPATAELPTTVKLRSFLQSRGARLSCPACGQNHWTIVETPGMQAGIPLLHDNRAVVMPPPNIPAYAMICDNCAYVRLHAKLIVDTA